MNFVSKLVAWLTLDNKQFKKGLKDSEKQTAKFGKQVSSVGRSIGTAFAVKAIFDFTRAISEANAKALDLKSGIRDIGEALRDVIGVEGRGGAGSYINVQLSNLADGLRVLTGQSKEYNDVAFYTNDYLKQLAENGANWNVSAEKQTKIVKLLAERWADYGEEIENANKQFLESIGLMSSDPFSLIIDPSADGAPGSIAYAEKQLKDLQNRLRYVTDPSRRYQIKVEIEALEADIKNKKTLREGTAGLDAMAIPIQQMDSITGNVNVVQELNAEIMEFNHNLERSIQLQTEFGMILDDVIRSAVAGVASAIAQLASELGNLIVSGDFSGAQILSSFGNFLSQLGAQMAVYGALILAFGTTQAAMITDPTPWGKIAEGAALLALGLAVSVAGGAISAMAGGSVGSPSGGYGGSYGGGYNTGLNNAYDYNREIVLVARGEDLVATINRQNYKNGING